MQQSSADKYRDKPANHTDLQPKPKPEPEEETIKKVTFCSKAIKIRTKTPIMQKEEGSEQPAGTSEKAIVAEPDP